MGVVYIVLFLFVCLLASEAQAAQQLEQNPNVVAVCRGEAPQSQIKLKGDRGDWVPGGAERSEFSVEYVADPRPWTGAEYPFEFEPASDSDACWSGLSKEQERLFQGLVASYNERTHQHLREEEVWARLDDSEHATFVSITYALEHTLLSDRRKRPEGRLSEYVDVISDVFGENAKYPDNHGDIQYRVYARLTVNAREALRASREFGEPGTNTFSHKGYPVSYRQQGGIPSIQISTDESGRAADIDIDFRSKNPFKQEGHLHPSNSDVRSKRGGICNYLRYLKRWPGWIRCHLRQCEKGENGTTPIRSDGNFAGSELRSSGQGGTSNRETVSELSPESGAGLY